MYKEIFGQQLKKIRTEYACMTQQEVADKLKISRNAISKYETGSLEPNLETIGKLCEILDTDPNTLFRYTKIR